jgi:hypothetical protein
MDNLNCTNRLCAMQIMIPFKQLEEIKNIVLPVYNVSLP